MNHVFPPIPYQKQETHHQLAYSLLRSKWPSIKQQSVIEIIYKRKYFYKKIMETKSDIKFSSENKCALNQSEIYAKKINTKQNIGKLHSLWKICTVEPAYRLYFNDKIKQQSANKMFQRPRRRKFDRKITRQGHNLCDIFGKMHCFTDNMTADDLIFVQNHQFMLKSCVLDTMWHI